MKKLVAASCLAGCLALAAPAISAVQTFSAGASKFSIEVPDGWTAVQVDDGCLMESADKKTAFKVVFKDAGGKSHSELAIFLVNETIKKHPEYKLLGIKDVGPYVTLMEYESNGVKVTVGISTKGGICAIVSAGGPEIGILSKVLGSVADSGQ